MEKIKQALLEKLQATFQSGSLGFEKKADNSPVTQIDIFVSGLLKSELKALESLKGYHFFSEEDQESFDFPCIVLDPIDGTRELVAGLPECCLSLALMASPSLADKNSEAWLYNPFTGFELGSQQGFVAPARTREGVLVGMVSNTGYGRGYFDNYDEDLINLFPKGSIAYKLGLLASGACDFVVSAGPKNIWDIAGGSLLLEQRGIHLYQNEKQLTELDQKRYDGVLLWCREVHLEQILKGLRPCMGWE